MTKNRFKHLLNLYLDGKASSRDHEELMQMIREGIHDEAIMGSIDEMLSNGQAEHHMDAQKTRKILSGILATADEQRKIISIHPAASRWRWVAAAAVLLMAVFFLWWTSRPKPVPEQVITLQDSKPESVVFTGKQFVRLPDGTTVLLNESSELRYSIFFGEHIREVTLIGEGYFEVQRDLSKPFKVRTGKITTTVLGTAFNIKAYPGQREIRVTVTRGRVQVGDDERTFGIITPDQQIAVNTVTNDFVQRNVKAEKAEAWKSQYLILDDASMEDAARIIGAKYGVKIILANNDVKKCRITATFLNGEDLDQVLTVVSGVVKATYVHQPDGNVKISGKGCK